MLHSTALLVVLSFVALWVMEVQLAFGMLLTARLTRFPSNGVKIGSGPVLYAWRQNGVECVARLFPLGGNLGWADPYGEENTLGRCLKTPRAWMWAQIRVRLGMVAINFATAFLTLILVGLVYGQPSFTLSNVVSSVMSGSPADKAGIRTDDAILAVEGIPTPTHEAMMQQIQGRANQPTHITLRTC